MVSSSSSTTGSSLPKGGIFPVSTSSSTAPPSSKKAVLSSLSSAALPTGPTFASAAVRSENSIALTKAQFPKSYRAAATAEERMKICKEACTGSAMKLKKIDYSKMVQESFSDDQFDSIVGMTTFLSTMKQHFVKYDMAYFFQFFPDLEPSETGDPNNQHDRFRSKKTVNLFDRWNQIGVKKDFILTKIADVVGWLQMYTDTSSNAYLEDLEWTHKYLMASMDPELAVAVQDVLNEQFAEHQQGGPLTFAVMLDQAVNLSPTVITNIQASIRSYSIANVPGEDIELVSRRMLHVFRSLENNRCLSADLVQHLFTLLSSTSVDRFNSLIQQWENSVLMGAEAMPTYKDILLKAVIYYKRLNSLNAWTPSASGSVFKAATRRCHQCGSEDHIRPDCPELYNPDGSRKKRSNPWLDPPSKSMKVSDNPLRYEKKIGDKLVRWCAKCGSKSAPGKWTTTHFSDEHHGGRPPAAANLASDDTDEANAPGTVTFKDALLDASKSQSSN